MQDIATAHPTMSSLEIAGLVESRHDKVKQSIERLAARAVIELPPLGKVKNHLQQTVAVYKLCKRDSYVVVAQLSPEFTARLVDRWQELESGAQHKLPQTMAEALRLAADQAEKIEQQQKEIEAARPSVEFVGRYVESTSGSATFRQVAKVLGANERELRQFLSERRIMYKMAGGWMPYQNHIDAGRFEVKTGTSDHGHAFSQSKFTAKGVTWIAELWGERS